MLIYSKRLSNRASHQTSVGMTDYGEAEDAKGAAKKDIAASINWQKRALTMIGADPQTPFQGNPLEDPRVLRLICKVLLEFDHVTETMES